jgi:hypothetical protein
MKTYSNAMISGLVSGLILLLGAFRIEWAASVLVLFALGMVAWTIKQYHHHHLH